MGAWIETVLKMLLSLRKKSHPMWVRGLKLLRNMRCKSVNDVAPYVGAWIETWCSKILSWLVKVAPYVGAWIETPSLAKKPYDFTSHPMWVRGLKLLWDM